MITKELSPTERSGLIFIFIYPRFRQYCQARQRYDRRAGTLHCPRIQRVQERIFPGRTGIEPSENLQTNRRRNRVHTRHNRSRSRHAHARVSK